ncbi:hypothetical protein GVAV_001508 [Gurleya vavrai]
MHRYIFHLENETVFLLSKLKINQKNFIYFYIKYKDESRIAPCIFLRCLLNQLDYAIIVIIKNDKTWFFKKGFEWYDLNIDNKNSKRIQEEFILSYENNFLFQFHLNISNEDYQTDFFIKQKNNNFKYNLESQVGYFAFFYIENLHPELFFDKDYCLQLDNIREILLRTFAFYNGNLVSNLLTYSIYKFEEACSSLHWAKFVSSTLDEYKFKINGSEIDIKFSIGIAQGSYDTFEEYKGGRNSFAGIGLNKAARIAKINSEKKIRFCKNIFEMAYPILLYFEIDSKLIGEFKMKGFFKKERIYCI